ncbi:hypothetical protein BDQ17DRAFT_1322663 [Cyathus striatus]|nr:hypothetical protein BDQ17DRAFT_1322663 [Cyathus striatus]
MSSVTSQLIAFANSTQLPSLENFDLQICRGRAPRAIEVLLQNIGQNLQSLGLYGLGWKDDERMNMVKLLQLTPNLKCLRSPRRFSILLTNGGQHRREMVSIPVAIALSKRKAYSDIICPQLEVFDCDLKLYTGISSSALKEFVAARQNGHLLDDRIASPRRVCIKLEELRKPEDPNEKQVSLGKDSTVYFKKDVNNYRRPELSPMSGLDQVKKTSDGTRTLHQGCHYTLISQFVHNVERGCGPPEPSLAASEKIIASNVRNSSSNAAIGSAFGATHNGEYGAPGAVAGGRDTYTSRYGLGHLVNCILRCYR